jgi:hypothetical protein
LKIRTVGDLNEAALGLLLPRPVGERKGKRIRRVACSGTNLRPHGFERPGQRAWEYVEVVQGDILQDVDRNGEIQAQHVWWCVGQPIRDQQRVEFCRVTIVETQDELGAVRSDGLQ